MSELKNCVVCEDKFQPAWTDWHGIANCNTCGMTYELKGFNNRKETIVTVTDDFLPILKEYWEATKQKMFLGHIIKPDEEQIAMNTKLNEWVREHHPEAINS